MIPHENINKVTPVLRTIWVKMIFYTVISLCSAIYRVQLFTVSNILLCPAHYCVQQNTVATLTQRVFVHLSHFHVLRSYHAALAKHLCSLKCPWRNTFAMTHLLPFFKYTWLKNGHALILGTFFLMQFWWLPYENATKVTPRVICFLFEYDFLFK